MNNYSYDKAILDAFVLGHEITEYNVEELKDNYKFMLDAVRFSKNKRIYDMASARVKNNIDFVVGAIKVFKNDELFVRKLYNDFINNCTDNLKTIFIIYMFNMYHADKSNFANYIKNQVDILYGRLNVDGKFKSIMETYNDTTINKFMARKYVYNMFYNDAKYSISGIVHKNINCKNAIDTDARGFVLKYVKKNDKELAQYLSFNDDIIRPIITDVKTELKRWDLYEDKLNSIRINKAVMLMFNYLKNNKQVNMELIILLSYLAYDLGLQQEFIKYDSNSSNKTSLNYLKYKDSYKNYPKEISMLDDIYDLKVELNNIFNEDYIGKKKK